MEGYRSSKRPKRNPDEKSVSTFECLTGELILELFEYFNSKEIHQSFFNLTSLINSSIYDDRQGLHFYLDYEMSSVPRKYSSARVMSLFIEHSIISIEIFVNLKSLTIVHDHHNAEETDCLQMVEQIFKLSQLFYLTLSFTGLELTSISQKIIETSFCHPFLQRIILSTNDKPRLQSTYQTPPVKLIFPSAKSIYVSDDFPGHKITDLHLVMKGRDRGPFLFNYYVRSLDLDFNNWGMRTLVNLLSSLPLLVELKIQGISQCAVILWFHPWDRIFQKLKALQRVTIDIRAWYPSKDIQQKISKFNTRVSQAIDTCKRINLKMAIEYRYRPYHCYCFRLTALLDMN